MTRPARQPLTTIDANPARAAAQHKADLARSLRLSTAEGIMAMPIVTMSLPVNVFMSALVVFAFPLSNATIGLMSALPFAGNFLQVLVTPLLARHRPPKQLTIAAAWCHWACWVALGVFLPALPRDNPGVAGHWLVAWFLLASCCSAIAGVTWNEWIQEWVPVRLRGKFFGRRNGILQLSTLTFLLVAGGALAYGDYALRVFQAIIAGAVAMRIFSLRWQWISPTRRRRKRGEGTAAPHPPRPIREQLRVVLHSPSLLGFIAFGAVWSFAANCFGPFYTVFMLERLGFSTWNVSLVNALSLLGGALSLPAWGLLLDRYGNKSVMAFSLLLWQAQNFAWCFLTPENRALLYPMWLWGGVTGAGFVLGQFTLILRLIPPAAKSLALAANLAVTSLVAALAPILGGQVLTWALARSADGFAVFHLCFLVQPLVALAGAALLLRVREPHASPLTMVFGAMRNIRTLSGVLGLDFFVNYVFYRPPKHER